MKSLKFILLAVLLLITTSCVYVDLNNAPPETYSRYFKTIVSQYGTPANVILNSESLEVTTIQLISYSNNFPIDNLGILKALKYLYPNAVYIAELSYNNWLVMTKPVKETSK